jgi:hypothetical protein
VKILSSRANRRGLLRVDMVAAFAAVQARRSIAWPRSFITEFDVAEVRRRADDSFGGGVVGQR